MLTFFAIFLTSEAFAGSALLCPLPGGLSGGSCPQNYAYAAAAQTCIQRLTLAVTSQQTALAALMAGNNSGAAEAQRAKEGNHIQNLEQMVSSLDSLIAQAQKAEDDLSTYAQQMAYPGKLSKSELESLGFGDLIGSFPCFANNQNAVSETASNIQTKIGQLQATKASALSLLGKSGEFESHLHNDSTGLVVSDKPVPAPEIPLPAQSVHGESQDTPSDITGTQRAIEEDEILQHSFGK